VATVDDADADADEQKVRTTIVPDAVASFWKIQVLEPGILTVQRFSTASFSKFKQTCTKTPRRVQKAIIVVPMYFQWHWLFPRKIHVEASAESLPFVKGELSAPTF
jgi:hypothetical protein